MDRRSLGRSGIKVSRLCLGTMMFGGSTDEPESRRILDHALDHGVDFIDTANAYSRGASEEILGRALKGRRESCILATKVGLGAGAEVATGGLSRPYVMREVEHSLKRLATDYIDIYYVHRHDPDTAYEDVVATFADLIRSGKIRAFGLSNVKAWHIAHIAHLCRETGCPGPAVLQPYYNLLNRTPEVEVLPAARFFGLGVVPYSPIARGVLSGKYVAGAKPPEGSRAARGDKRLLSTEWRPGSLEIAAELKAHAESRNATLVDFAVAWVLNNAAVTSCLAGPRTLAQWESYLTALDYDWTGEDEALVDRLVSPGHPSTPGYTDPKEPPEGRFAAMG